MFIWKSSRELAVQVFYSQFKFKFSFIFRSLSAWRLLFQLATIVSSILVGQKSASTWCIYQRTDEFEQYKVTCWFQSRENSNRKKLLLKYTIAYQYTIFIVRIGGEMAYLFCYISRSFHWETGSQKYLREKQHFY